MYERNFDFFSFLGKISINFIEYTSHPLLILIFIVIIVILYYGLIFDDWFYLSTIQNNSMLASVYVCDYMVLYQRFEFWNTYLVFSHIFNDILMWFFNSQLSHCFFPRLHTICRINMFSVLMDIEKDCYKFEIEVSLQTKQ